MQLVVYSFAAIATSSTGVAAAGVEAEVVLVFAAEFEVFGVAAVWLHAKMKVANAITKINSFVRFIRGSPNNLNKDSQKFNVMVVVNAIFVIERFIPLQIDRNFKQIKSNAASLTSFL